MSLKEKVVKKRGEGQTLHGWQYGSRVIDSYSNPKNMRAMSNELFFRKTRKPPPRFSLTIPSQIDLRRFKQAGNRRRTKLPQEVFA
eukprot:CAMPEP_0170501474 /NCGR_PEP_ID=MMETSP0208-20121228/38415_1 /TAXON_ID=197538 /ORGANISM="Strombidium inclinatum, Strain S3" /LENGTH=85 /DNA_ID=CAMNT_0010780047 /DNA_START=663 /DNA_END=920 /DNA_ORIENTATION=+